MTGKKKLILGADGGGTKTSIIVIDADSGELTGSVLSGGINYNFISPSDAAENIVSAARRLCGDGELTAAGIGDPAYDDICDAAGSGEFKALLEKKLGARVFIRSDAYMALYGLTLGKPGALLIAGTGAMAISEDAAGVVRVAGGWGRLTGDEGGGYYIAQSGIKAALRYYDGIAPKTALLEAMKSYFGCRDERALIGRFYADPYVFPDIAGFSSEVSRCAADGDAQARDILLRAAGFLAGYSTSLLKKSGGRLLGIYGGVIMNDSIVRTEFLRLMKERIPEVAIREPKFKPEYAAALYAGINAGFPEARNKSKNQKSEDTTA